jgi:pimeloyl-ACP methyl ester carboxylesterase
MSIPIETLRTERFSMRYFRFGSGKKTFVILPGLAVQSVTGAAEAVAQGYAAFTEAYTVYVFDRRSELPPVYSIRDMARDTAEAMLALGLRDVDLFGASQGGMMALVIAMDYPQLVHKLVLGSTSSHVLPAQFAVVENWIRLARAGDREGLYLSFGEELYPPAVFAQAREGLLAAAKTVTDEDLDRFVILARASGTLTSPISSLKSAARCWPSAFLRTRCWTPTPRWRSPRSWTSGPTSSSSCTSATATPPLTPRRTIGIGSAPS